MMKNTAKIYSQNLARLHVDTNLLAKMGSKSSSGSKGDEMIDEEILLPDETIKLQITMRSMLIG